jgi:hypothetical protein
MKKKTRATKNKIDLRSEKEYWDYYQTLTLTYKTINLNNWKKLFTGIIQHKPEDILAKNMLLRCIEEEEKLKILKEEQVKKLDEELYAPQVSLKRIKK